MIRLIHEYNPEGHLFYIENFPGAYIRGETAENALRKLNSEISQYCLWVETSCDSLGDSYSVVQEKLSSLQICDADSDIIFDSEKTVLISDEYMTLKSLTLKSAEDFHRLYLSVPDKCNTVLSPRKTFYGNVPVTAEEMYQHTKSVNSYYFGEISVDVGNEPDIVSCRAKGFELLEQNPDFLNNRVFDGSYGEQWSLRKLCRRFIWHDRIHAKAMFRMAVRLCGTDRVVNPFHFSL